MTDKDYYAHRAAQEVKLAQTAKHPAAVAAHYRLSTAYLERLEPPLATPGSEPR